LASIRTNKLAGGRESYTLQWREQGEQRGINFDNKPEAERWKKLLDANGQSLAQAQEIYEVTQGEGPTVAEAMVAHIDQLVGTTPYTIKRYRSAVRLHFSGPLGQTKIKAVTHDHVIEWIKWMQDRGKGPKTISLQHGLLSATMETAERREIISKNPCRGVRLPKKARIGADGDDIDLDDFRSIRGRTDPHFQPFLDFLVGTGCRFSEATPLVASDFALDANPPMVYITKAHKLGGDENPARYVGEPKSKKSRRRVSLAPSTTESIRPLVEAATDGMPVFHMKEGGVLTSQSFYNHSWEQARREAGLGIGSPKHVTVHSLRHLHAAIMLHSGMSLYELSVRMGHTSIQITADLYAHLLPDAHWKGAQYAHKALGGVPLGEVGGEFDNLSKVM
jgi:integrase